MHQGAGCFLRKHHFMLHNDKSMSVNIILYNFKAGERKMPQRVQSQIAVARGLVLYIGEPLGIC